MLHRTGGWLHEVDVIADCLDLIRAGRRQRRVSGIERHCRIVAHRADGLVERPQVGIDRCDVRQSDEHSHQQHEHDARDCETLSKVPWFRGHDRVRITFMRGFATMRWVALVGRRHGRFELFI